jgi:hypothetical protein
MAMVTPLDQAHAELDVMNAEQEAAKRGMPCWQCNRRVKQCGLQDCPRVWRLRDPIKLATEGRKR